MTGYDYDYSIENEDIYNEDEGTVDFGSPDLYDVQELIELSLEDAGIGVLENEVPDEVKQLNKDYIGKSSTISYHYSFVNFLFYIYRFD